MAVSANLDEIRQLSGIKDAFIVEGNDNVRELSSGVAIIGTSTWAVFNAKQKLNVKWDESNASKDSWTELVASANQIKDKPGTDLITENGDVDDEFSNPDNKTISAFYQYPFVSHLCLEPMNCSAHYEAGENGDHPHMALRRQDTV